MKASESALLEARRVYDIAVSEDGYTMRIEAALKRWKETERAIFNEPVFHHVLLVVPSLKRKTNVYGLEECSLGVVSNDGSYVVLAAKSKTFTRLNNDQVDMTDVEMWPC